ncbi:hypothetical protein [Alloscardovia omnicolens]|uniref:hypothetical protein n=1 Tax=Alloscardovia omnicolens TaxID=419015 RepID=UPI003A72181A
MNELGRKQEEMFKFYVSSLRSAGFDDYADEAEASYDNGAESDVAFCIAVFYFEMCGLTTSEDYARTSLEIVTDEEDYEAIKACQSLLDRAL